MIFQRSLLGSIAFLCSSSTLFAANSVLDAEPVEYVRVCEAYGKGYFYIPGTETCMNMSGYVRHEIGVGDDVSGQTVDDVFGKKTDSYRSKTRAELKFHTKAETDLGTMTTLITLRSEWKNGKDGSSGQIRRGYVELEGFRVGLVETSFYEWTDKYGEVLNDDILGPASHRTNAVSYTYSGDHGISGIIALEQGIGDEGEGYHYKLDDNGSPWVSKAYHLRQRIDNYVPNIVAGLKYEGSWGSIATVAAYDSYYEEWAARLRLNMNVTDKLSLWLMGAYKSAEDYYAVDESYGNKGLKIHSDGRRSFGIYRQINSMYGDWGGDWAVWGGGTLDLNKKSSFNFQLAYEDAGTMMAAANVKYKIASGLVLTPEIAYMSWDDDYGYKTADGSYEVRQSLKGRDAFTGMVRLQRSF
ncbi:porin [Bartonella sp. LJL80]